jgi:hypothetical protein
MLLELPLEHCCLNSLPEPLLEPLPYNCCLICCLNLLLEPLLELPL